MKSIDPYLSHFGKENQLPVFLAVNISHIIAGIQKDRGGRAQSRLRPPTIVRPRLTHLTLITGCRDPESSSGDAEQRV